MIAQIPRVVLCIIRTRLFRSVGNMPAWETALLTRINSPEHLAKLLHLGISSNGHPQHAMQWRKRTPDRHSSAKHFLSECLHVATNIDHHEIRMRLDIADLLLP